METAVEWLLENLNSEPYSEEEFNYNSDCWDKALEMEKKQIFLASNQSAKEAYKAGQKTMNCGCYEISDATAYEEYLYEKIKSK